MNTKKPCCQSLLVTLGIVVLAYSGITFSTPGKPVRLPWNAFLKPQSAILSHQPVGALGARWRIMLLLVNPKRVLMNQGRKSKPVPKMKGRPRSSLANQFVELGSRRQI